MTGWRLLRGGLGRPGASLRRNLLWRAAPLAVLGLLAAVLLAIHACGTTTETPPRDDAREDVFAPPDPIVLRSNPFDPSAFEEPPEIRVLLSRVQKARRITFERTRNFGGPRERLVAEARPGGVALDGVVHRPPVDVAGIAFRIAERDYQGHLSLHLDPDGGLRAILRVPLEPYVTGVVAGEMPLSWPAAALEAQAIAARTYALHRRATRLDETWDVTDDTRSQVFVGVPPSDRWSAGLRAAVDGTRSRVLARDRRLANAVYHATCGGRTVSTLEAFGSVGGDRVDGARCDDCARAPRHRWTIDITTADAARATGTRASELRKLTVIARAASGRAVELRAEGSRGSTRVLAGRFRESLGAKLPSTWIVSLERTRTGFRVRGRGYGHGAGMCQWGAAGKAKRGLSSTGILADYYPGFSLVRIEVR